MKIKITDECEAICELIYLKNEKNIAHDIISNYCTFLEVGVNCYGELMYLMSYEEFILWSSILRSIKKIEIFKENIKSIKKKYNKYNNKNEGYNNGLNFLSRALKILNNFKILKIKNLNDLKNLDIKFYFMVKLYKNVFDLNFDSSAFLQTEYKIRSY